MHPTSLTRARCHALAWATPLGALAAAFLSFGTGGVSLLALACLALLSLLSAHHLAAAHDPAAATLEQLGPRWLLLGFLAPALVVGLATRSPLGALEGLLWGGFVRLFLLHHLLGSSDALSRPPNLLGRLIRGLAGLLAAPKLRRRRA